MPQGRALRLIVQNVGGGRPGEATGRRLASRASTPTAAPRTKREPVGAAVGGAWFRAPERSTVTVVGALSPLNVTTHAKDAQTLLRVFARTLPYPMCNDYVYSGEPWIVLTPEIAGMCSSRAASPKAM